MDTIKKAMVAAMKKHYGRVTRACNDIDLARATHYGWMKDDPEYAEAIQGVKEMAIDHVESKLFEKIDGIQIQKGVNENGEPIVYDVPPSDTAIIFYLKTQAKHRGYVERQELTGADGGPVQIIAPDSI